MKKSVVLASLFLSTLSIAQIAEANVIMYGDPCVVGRGGRCAEYGSVYGTCAPEVREGNVAAVDRTLAELSNGTLASQVKFHSLIATAQAMPEAEKMNAYLALVDAKTDSDIVDFISAREISPKYITALQKNADLSEEQSRLVIGRLSEALIGQKK